MSILSEEKMSRVYQQDRIRRLTDVCLDSDILGLYREVITGAQEDDELNLAFLLPVLLALNSAFVEGVEAAFEFGGREAGEEDENK